MPRCEAVMVCQPWVSASPLWLTADSHTGATISFSSWPFGLQTSQDAKSKSTVLNKGLVQFLLFCKFLMKIQETAGNWYEGKEFTDTGRGRRKGDKTKAVKTAACPLFSFHYISISEPRDAQALSAGLQMHFTFSDLFRWINDTFRKTRQVLGKMDSIVNVK